MTPQDLSAQALISAVYDYNRTPHSATATAPLTAFFGVPSHLPLDTKLGTNPPAPVPQATIRANQQAFAAAWARRLNTNRPQFQVGDQVLFYPALATTEAHAANRHLRRRSYGPFTVVGFRCHNRVLVSGAGQERFTFPAARLRISHLP
jgi:hypothetical protein